MNQISIPKYDKVPKCEICTCVLEAYKRELNYKNTKNPIIIHTPISGRSLINKKRCKDCESYPHNM